MSDENGNFDTQLGDAITDRDAVLVKQLMSQSEFVILCVKDEEDEDDEDAANLLSADVDGMDVLVAFTSEKAAGDFVESMEEMYEEDDEIEGYVLDGNSLLEFMPTEHGLLINPESEEAYVIDMEFVSMIQQAEA